MLNVESTYDIAKVATTALESTATVIKEASSSNDEIAVTVEKTLPVIESKTEIKAQVTDEQVNAVTSADNKITKEKI